MVKTVRWLRVSLNFRAQCRGAKFQEQARYLPRPRNGPKWILACRGSEGLRDGPINIWRICKKQKKMIVRSKFIKFIKCFFFSIKTLVVLEFLVIKFRQFDEKNWETRKDDSCLKSVKISFGATHCPSSSDLFGAAAAKCSDVAPFISCALGSLP